MAKGGMTGGVRREAGGVRGEAESIGRFVNWSIRRTGDRGKRGNEWGIITRAWVYPWRGGKPWAILPVQPGAVWWNVVLSGQTSPGWSCPDGPADGRTKPDEDPSSNDCRGIPGSR